MVKYYHLFSDVTHHASRQLVVKNLFTNEDRPEVQLSGGSWDLRRNTPSPRDFALETHHKWGILCVTARGFGKELGQQMSNWAHALRYILLGKIIFLFDYISLSFQITFKSNPLYFYLFINFLGLPNNSINI